MYNLCIGTAQFGMSYGIANTSGKLSYCQVKQIIKTATENKIFYYDTAPVYGDSEKLLGQAISEYGINKEVRLISKIPPNLTSLTKLQKQVEESLNRLKIKDYWGLLCHRYEDLNNDIIEYSMFLKDKKIIKYFGVSVYEPSEAVELVYNDSIDIIQVPFNVLDRRLIDNNFFNLARNKNKIIFIRSVFLQGLITLDERKLMEMKMSWASEYLKKLIEYTSSYNIDIKQFALNMIIDYVKDGMAIVGVDSQAQLIENINYIDTVKLDERIINEWWENLPLYPRKLLNPSLWN